MSLLVIDKTDESELRDLFTLFGTPYKGTKLFWLNPPLMIITGIIIAFIFAPVADPVARIIGGVFYGFIIMSASVIHSYGHIVSSRRVGAPVTYILATMTVSILHYDDTEDLLPRVHIGRAIGGPLASMNAGLLGLALYATLQSHFLAFFAFINLLFFVLTISPLPSLDGEVILRAMRK